MSEFILNVLGIEASFEACDNYCDGSCICDCDSGNCECNTR